jgi:hypothetical protein
MPTLAGPPIDAHHNWIYPPHPYMIMSLRILEDNSGRIFCVSKCDDRGSMWDYWEAKRLMASKTADVPHSAT